MRISLIQFDPRVGDLDHNAHKIRDLAKKGCESGANLAIFSELSLCGYPPKDLLHRSYFVARCREALGQLHEELSIPALVGSVSEDSSGALYNSVFLIGGEEKSVVHKKLLPNYEVFNEARYFQPGEILDETSLIDINGQKLAVLICEDLLALEEDYRGYKRDVLNELKAIINMGSIQLAGMVCASASPYRVGKFTKRLETAKRAQSEYLGSVPIVLVNQVGANDDLIFDGNSFVLGADGDLHVQLPPFRESIVCYDLQNPPIEPARSLPTSPVAEKREALVLGIRDYFQKSGFERALIGVSGGVDSALVAALAVQSLGPENVEGVIMPTAYTSSESLELARELLAALQCRSKEIDIEPILQSFITQSGINRLSIAEENSQSRLRGNILMGLANQQGALVLATGNKSEFSVGYSTLYGDMCGALAPIGDLWKTDVWSMASSFDEIPEGILRRPPSAELRPNQLDTDSLPGYDLLDGILKLYLEEGKSLEQIVRAGYEEEVVRRLIEMFARSEFKRRQAPIILKVSSQAFGSGWLQPLAAHLI